MQMLHKITKQLRQKHYIAIRNEVINRTVHRVSFSSMVSTEPLGSWMLFVSVICEQNDCDLETQSPVLGSSSAAHRNVWFLLCLWVADERAGTRGAAFRANTERSHVQNSNLRANTPSAWATSQPSLKCRRSPVRELDLQVSAWWDRKSATAARCWCWFDPGAFSLPGLCDAMKEKWGEKLGRLKKKKNIQFTCNSRLLNHHMWLCER